MVQVRPANARPPSPGFILSRERDEKWKDNNNVKALALPCRLDLNNPPTAVGGIQDFRFLFHDVRSTALSESAAAPLYLEVQA